MVGVKCIPEPQPNNVLAGLSPSLASFMQQLPPLNGSAPDLDMLISTLLQNNIPSNNSDSTSMIPWASSARPSSSPAIYNISSLKQGTPLNVSNMRSSNAGQGCGQSIKSSYTQSNTAWPTLKLRDGNGAHAINTPPSLQSFIDKLPAVNGPSPNVDNVISVICNGVITRNGDFYGPSRRANASTMKSIQSSHQLKRRRDDDDKEDLIHEKPAMDIFKLRQLKKLRAMAGNESGSTSQTSSRSSCS